MNCRQAAGVLFLFFDNEMNEEERASLKDHLERCPNCERRLAYTRKLLIVVRKRCHRRSAPPSLRQRILLSLPHRQEWT
jgi:mycothiol system anti-sigma-R factor